MAGRTFNISSWKLLLHRVVSAFRWMKHDPMAMYAGHIHQQRSSCPSCFRYTATRVISGRRTLSPQLARLTAIVWSHQAIISHHSSQRSGENCHNLRIDVEGCVLCKSISSGSPRLCTADLTSPATCIASIEVIRTAALPPQCSYET
jgi:hypothetical protein